ncbi:MAG: DUF6384 family protein [Candidatus Promineifilaceae bacterium]
MSAGPAGGRDKAPLDDVMLAMDVVDTLRHRQDLVVRELDGRGARKAAAREAARHLPPAGHRGDRRGAASEGVAALDESRFAYTPPKPSFGVTLARLYVGRKRWGPAALAIALLLVVGLGGYFLAWRPYAGRRRPKQARLELAERLPAQMDALYQHDLRGNQGAAGGDRRRRASATAARPRPPRATAPGAEQAIADLTALRDTAAAGIPRCGSSAATGAKIGLLDLPRDQHGGDQLLRRGRGHRARRQGAEPADHSTRRTTRPRRSLSGACACPKAVYRSVEADKTRRRHHPAQHRRASSSSASSMSTTSCRCLAAR